MANTTRKRITKVLLELAEKNTNPRVQIEAVKLLMILKSRFSPETSQEIDPTLAEILGLKPPEDESTKGNLV